MVFRHYAFLPLSCPDGHPCPPLYHPLFPPPSPTLTMPAHSPWTTALACWSGWRGSPTPRDRRGRRHTLASVLAISAAAVLAGARAVTAIAEWATNAPGPVLAALGCAVTCSPAAARSPARPPSAGCWHGSTAIGSTGRSARGWPPGRARRAPHARAGAPARA